jgi:hypothetical protein
MNPIAPTSIADTSPYEPSRNGSTSRTTELVAVGDRYTAKASEVAGMFEQRSVKKP